jgi:predicted nucleic acid-binding Zn finger protein
VSAQFAPKVSGVIGREWLLVEGFEDCYDFVGVVLQEVRAGCAILSQLRLNALEETSFDAFEHFGDKFGHMLENAVGIEDAERVLKLRGHFYDEYLFVLDVVVDEAAAILAELEVLVEEAHVLVGGLEVLFELLLDLDDGRPRKELESERRLVGNLVLEMDFYLLRLLRRIRVHICPKILSYKARAPLHSSTPQPTPYCPNSKANTAVIE